MLSTVYPPISARTSSLRFTVVQCHVAVYQSNSSAITCEGDGNQIYSPSAGAVEHIVASFSRNRPKVSHLTRHLHDAMYDMTLLHALTHGNVRLATSYLVKLFVESHRSSLALLVQTQMFVSEGAELSFTP
jgi:hypothetical protein